jgi:hypothetical protein
VVITATLTTTSAERLAGASNTYTATHIIRKIIVGAGADGATGKKTITHFVYHQASASSAPTKPSATNYNISNNTFSGLTSGWATTPPTFVAGNTNKYWYSYFTAIEDTAGGNISSGSNLVFQNSLQGIGFQGLVTFSSGNMTDGSNTYNPATIINANTTTIDGGKITTDSIALNRLDFAPVTSVAGVTGNSISAAQLSSAGLYLSSNPSSFVNSSQAGAAAPVQSVAGLTGAVNTAQLSAAGLYLSSNPSGFVNSSQAGSAAPVQSVAGATGAVSASTIITAGNIIVAGANISTLTNNSGYIPGSSVNANVTSISGGVISTGTVNSARINVDTLEVKNFANVSTQIVSHLSSAAKFKLGVEAATYIQRSGTYTGSNAAFVPVTLQNIRDNAGYVAIFSGVLGNVSGGRVQYSLDNSNWTNANGNTNIYWQAGTYRGYTYVYTGQITTLSTSQSTVYWRVYFSGGYNHTQLALNVMMDNTR